MLMPFEHESHPYPFSEGVQSLNIDERSYTGVVAQILQDRLGRDGHPGAYAHNETRREVATLPLFGGSDGARLRRDRFLFLKEREVALVFLPGALGPQGDKKRARNRELFLFVRNDEFAGGVLFQLHVTRDTAPRGMITPQRADTDFADRVRRTGIGGVGGALAKTDCPGAVGHLIFRINKASEGRRNGMHRCGEILLRVALP